MTTQYFKVRNGLTVGEDAVTVDGTTGATTIAGEYTLPVVDGSADQIIKTDGAGNLSWYTPTDTNTTYTIDASSTTGGANLNLVGSDSTTDTVKLSNGGHITATYTSATEVTLGSDATDANTVSTIVARDASGNFSASGATLGNITVGVADDQTITTTSGNLILDSAGGTLQLSDAAISSPVAQTWTVVDNTASALSIGSTGKADILKIVTTDGSEQLTTSAQFTGDSASLSRFIRTASGAASNAVLELSRNRTDSVRVADQGAWLGFGYVGTDNTQATAGQNAIRSMYDSTGNHKLQFLQIPGSYASPTAIGQMQRGNTFFNNTFGGNMLLLTDTAATVRGTTTTIANSANTSTYATFTSTGIALNNITNITGAGLSTITRTTVGTPGTPEARPSFNIQLTRSDQAAPNDFDGTGFRYRVAGSNSTAYTIADMATSYRTGGDNQWQLQLANGDQTGATFSGLTTIQSKITSTTIAAGTASGTPGASSVSTVATFNPTQTLLAAGGTTYASLSSTGNTLTSSGRTNIARTTPGTGLLVFQQTAASDPANNDEIDLRLGVAGTVTSSNFARFDGTYKSSGDNEIGMSVSTDSFSADTDRIYVGSRASTKIRTTPSGGGTAGDTATFTQLATTLKSDALTLQDAAGTSLKGGNINYRRTYGCFHKVANITAAAANTVYNFDWYTDTTAHVGNQGVTVTSGNPTRVNFDVAGSYEAIVEMQAKNTDNADRIAWVWLAKNGTDIAETRIKVQLRAVGSGTAYQFITKAWCLDNIAANDYVEVRFAVDNTSGISLEYEAAQASPFVMPAQPSATFTVVPVGA